MPSVKKIISLPNSKKFKSWKPLSYNEDKPYIILDGQKNDHFAYQADEEPSLNDFYT